MQYKDGYTMGVSGSCVYHVTHRTVTVVGALLLGPVDLKFAAWRSS